MVGPPGTGKTLLGWAVAGEAEVPSTARSSSTSSRTSAGNQPATATRCSPSVVTLATDVLSRRNRSEDIGLKGGSPLSEASGRFHRGVMESMTTERPTVLTPEAISRLPVEPAMTPQGPADGVTNRLLWRTDTSMAGVMTVQAGHRVGTHTHRLNRHHIWVVDGRAAILGQELGPGSYVHIPAGIAHDLDATNTGGCTVFYLYVLPAG
jgi:quercetin dioxygenase-like cupin family protein